MSIEDIFSEDDDMSLSSSNLVKNTIGTFKLIDEKLDDPKLDVVENLEEQEDKINGETGTENENESTIPVFTEPVIRNVVCNIKVDCSLDPKFIAMRTKNSEYNPKRFPACIFKILNPKTTNLIFPGGRIVTVGGKTEKEGRLALRKIVRILQKLGYKEAKFQHFIIQNIIANFRVNFPIRLEGLAYSHSKYCKFEPEVFSGLVYRMAVPRVCLLIFVSGRIVITGAKDSDEVKKAAENIYPVLLDFKGR